MLVLNLYDYYLQLKAHDILSADAENDYLSANTGKRGTCVVSGEKNVTLARIHPAIKGLAAGFRGGSKLIAGSTGGTTSFASYGAEAEDVAPVKAEIAFGYTAALNYLLKSPKHHKNTATNGLIWWTDVIDHPINNTIKDLMGCDVKKKSPSFTTIGKVSFDGYKTDDTIIHVLCVTPAVSRLSVQYYHRMQVSDFAENAADFIQSLKTANDYTLYEIARCWKSLIHAEPRIDNLVYFFEALSTGKTLPKAWLSFAVTGFKNQQVVDACCVAVIESIGGIDWRS